eukprot:Rhum_TRINITY_DN8975_c0_g1::Rhum_TRINITY_DN8975_c0_g1_i1::g.30881::m.30881
MFSRRNSSKKSKKRKEKQATRTTPPKAAHTQHLNHGRSQPPCCRRAQCRQQPPPLVSPLHPAQAREGAAFAPHTVPDAPRGMARRLRPDVRGVRAPHGPVRCGQDARGPLGRLLAHRAPGGVVRGAEVRRGGCGRCAHRRQSAAPCCTASPVPGARGLLPLRLGGQAVRDLPRGLGEVAAPPVHRRHLEVRAACVSAGGGVRGGAPPSPRRAVPGVCACGCGHGGGDGWGCVATLERGGQDGWRVCRTVVQLVVCACRRLGLSGTALLLVGLRTLRARTLPCWLLDDGQLCGWNPAFPESPQGVAGPRVACCGAPDRVSALRPCGS